MTLSELLKARDDATTYATTAEAKLKAAADALGKAIDAGSLAVEAAKIEVAKAGVAVTASNQAIFDLLAAKGDIAIVTKDGTVTVYKAVEPSPTSPGYKTTQPIVEDSTPAPAPVPALKVETAPALKG